MIIRRTMPIMCIQLYAIYYMIMEVINYWNITIRGIIINHYT